MPIHCDNQAAIFIINNLTFHKRTKYIEVDCQGAISTPFVPFTEKLVDVFTKGLGVGVFEILYNKLDMIDIYAPT